MSRFNTATRTGTRSAITSTVPAATALGGAGYDRDPKSELFLLAVSNMVNPGGAFHEDAAARDERYSNLVRQVAEDTEWMLGFLGFLRNTANMRTASIIAAVVAVRARLDAKVYGGNRQIISSVLQRADEPGELLACWRSTYGRAVPSAVKRGIADAVNRLYTEKSYLKHDSDARGYRFADVLCVTHPKTGDTDKLALYRHILDVRYHPEVTEQYRNSVPMIAARKAITTSSAEARRSLTAGQLKAAGLTWEALAGTRQAEMDAAAWESAIPSMGYMALLRNLRNFDKAGISRLARREVEDRLTNPDEVARSRQFPLRFLSAYKATRDSGTVTSWGPVLEEAMQLSVRNVPTLPGRTLVLVDLSGSMYGSKLSDKSELDFVDAATVFGAALAVRNPVGAVDLFGFGSASVEYPDAVMGVYYDRSSSVLPLAERMKNVQVHVTSYWSTQRTFVQQGLGGTDTGRAVQATWAPNQHDRLIIITDEQWGGHGTVDLQSQLAKIDKPVYVWNLAGYRVGQMESGGRRQHTFGGLTDAAFKMIPLIEAGENQDWPWS